MKITIELENNKSYTFTHIKPEEFRMTHEHVEIHKPKLDVVFNKKFVAMISYTTEKGD